MVQLLGLSIKYRSRKVKFEDSEDTGDRDVYLSHLQSFKWVAWLMWVFCCFVTMTSWWGEPISCFSDTHQIVSNKLLTSYCFVTIKSYQW